MSEFTHLNKKGMARMVDTTAKEITVRRAIARGEVHVSGEVIKIIMEGKVPKGDVLSAARIAGIMGSKRVPDLVPLCHPIPLDSVTVSVDVDLTKQAIEIEAEVRAKWRTGVEMEAITAVSTAAITIYDMCKSIDKNMVIGNIRLILKQGGKSGTYERNEE